MLFTLSNHALGSTIVKCENRFGDITYADAKCPAGSTQLSKTTMRPYKTSRNISNKDLQNVDAFPEPDRQISRQQQALFVSRMSKVLTSLSTIKFQLVEKFTETGQWPDSFHQIGLDPAELHSTLVNKTILKKSGRLHIELKSLFGNDKQIWLVPQSVMGGTQVEWRCYANFPASWFELSQQEICQSRML